MIILSAPSGVTNMAGANAYAAKLAISPTITVIRAYIHQNVHIVIPKKRNMNM